MSASSQQSDGSAPSTLVEGLNYDFCPWANKYVYWLKEPVGWVVIAIGISVLVGLYVSHVGWVLAAAATAILVLGMAWPAIVVFGASCRLAPVRSGVHEEDACDLRLTVRNRLPIPLWGVAIEGYLDCDSDNIAPTIALASVPPLSTASYKLPVHPAMRGNYPIIQPKIASSFPLGIWTAHRDLLDVQRLKVWPKVFSINDEKEFFGGKRSEVGVGQLAGDLGDLNGVRPFRQGDRLRNIHWTQSARTEQLIVCERTAPERTAVVINLDAQQLPEPGVSTEAARQNIAWRVRIAATVAIHLHAHQIPVTLKVGKRTFAATPGGAGRRAILDILADVPVDGISDLPESEPERAHKTASVISILASRVDTVRVELLNTGTGDHSKATTDYCEFSLTEGDVSERMVIWMRHFWRSLEHSGALHRVGA